MFGSWINQIISLVLFIRVSLIKFIEAFKEEITIEDRRTVHWISKHGSKRCTTPEEMWRTGPSALGGLIERLNFREASWSHAQEMARSVWAISPVFSRDELNSPELLPSMRPRFVSFLAKIKKSVEKNICRESKISQDMVAKGVALYFAHTGRRAVFFVYSFTNDLDNIELRMTGPRSVDIEIRRRPDCLMCGYIAPVNGNYYLDISKNGWFSPGSPFEINVQDPPVGYHGLFGANLWDECDKNQNQRTNSDVWSTNLFGWGKFLPVIKSFETLKSNSSDKFKTCPQWDANMLIPQKDTLPKVAANILVAQKLHKKLHVRSVFHFLPQSPMEFKIWPSMTAFGPPQKEIIYSSPDGATFPIYINIEPITMAERGYSIEVLKSDWNADPWKLDERKELTTDEALWNSLASMNNSVQFSSTNNWSNNNSMRFPSIEINTNEMVLHETEDDEEVYEPFEVDFEAAFASENLPEPTIQARSCLYSEEMSFPSKLERPVSIRPCKLVGKGNSRSILSGLDAIGGEKKEKLRRTQSAISKLNRAPSRGSSPGLRVTNRALVKIGSYPNNAISREEIKMSTSVKKMKTFWNDFCSRNNAPQAKKIATKTSGLVARRRAFLEGSTKRDDAAGEGESCSQPAEADEIDLGGRVRKRKRTSPLWKAINFINRYRRGQGRNSKRAVKKSYSDVPPVRRPRTA